MNSSAFGILMMLFSLISGGGSNHDVLDIMTSDSYWRVKSVQVTVEQLRHDATGINFVADADKWVKDLSSGDFQVRDAARSRLKAAGVAALDALKPAAQSKDPEVAAAAGELIEQIATHVKELKIRQLMAIRTLGERKDKESLDTLKPLLDSKEPFVAAYAKRAIAVINGEAFVPVDYHPDLAADLAILPAECGIVGQTTGLGAANLNIDTVVEKIFAGTKPEDVPQFRPNQKAGLPDKQKTIDALTGQLLAIVEQIGDLRGDGVTFGISKDIGERGGWVVVSFRGEYDSKATMEWVKRMADNQDPNSYSPVTLYKFNNINAIQLEEEVTLLLPSDHQLILTVADGRRSPVAAVVVPVALALLTGNGGLEPGSAIEGLVKSTDKSGAGWAAGVMNEPLKHAIPPLSQVDSAVVTAKAAKNGFDLSLTAKTTVSPDENVGLAGTVNIGMVAVLAEAQREVERTPAMSIVVDFLKSVKAAATPTGGTITATLPGNIGEAMISSMRYELVYMMNPDNQPGMGGMQVPLDVNPPAVLP